MFHDSPVVKMKCRTNEQAKYIGWISQVLKRNQNSPKSNYWLLCLIQKAEEVHVLYERNILACIDGCGLYHYLKTARIYAAKGIPSAFYVLSIYKRE